MAIVACTLGSILTATRAALIAANVVGDPACWLTLDDEDLPGSTVEPPLLAVGFVGFDQRADTQYAGMDDTDTPVMEGELVVTLWTRTNLDQAGQDTIALTDGALGMSKLAQQVIGALNNENLTSGADTLTWRSLTLLGVRNRGRYRKEPSWRRLSVRFNCCFSFLPR